MKKKHISFQIAWATLHLTAAFMHFGSFVYHMLKVNEDLDSVDEA